MDEPLDLYPLDSGQVPDQEGGIAAIVALAHKPTVLDRPDGSAYLFWPSGEGSMVMERIPALNPKLPDHIQQFVKLDDQQSLIAYAKRFDLERAVAFVTRSPASVKIIFDYHDNDASAVVEGIPGRKAHTALWQMPYSDAWTEWGGINDKYLDQKTFADFIERHLADIAEPAGAEMLEIVTNLTMSKKIEFVSGMRLQDGQQQLTWQEDLEATAGGTKGRGYFTIPSEIVLGIPVFRGGSAYRMPCFLRYRLNDGGVNFRVTIQRMQDVIDTAVKESADAIRDACGIPIYMGQLG